jgi:hypothetical protein
VRRFWKSATAYAFLEDITIWNNETLAVINEFFPNELAKNKQ